MAVILYIYREKTMSFFPSFLVHPGNPGQNSAPDYTGLPIVNVTTTIAAAIASLGGSPGIINIPAGTFNESVTLPHDGIHLIGAGAGSTILQPTASVDNIVYGKHVRNCSVQNLTVDGSNARLRGIFFWYAENIFIADCEAINLTRTGIQTRYVQNYSICGSTIDNCDTHGIAFDGAVGSDTTIAQATATFNSDYQGIGAVFDTDFVIVNNVISNVGDTGISHDGVFGEIAFNNISNAATQAFKTQSGSDMTIHGNTSSNSGSLYWRVASELSDRPPGGDGAIVFWNNNWTAESGMVFRVDDAVNVCFADNHYNTGSTFDVDTSTNVTYVNLPNSSDNELSANVTLDNDMTISTDSQCISLVTGLTCDAGGDITITDSTGSGDQTITLDASATTANFSTIVSYEWEELSQTVTGITDGVQTSVTLPVGTWLIRLTVTDDNGSTCTDDIQVDVLANTSANDVCILIVPL
jgi:hypothetical protein